MDYKKEGKTSRVDEVYEKLIAKFIAKELVPGHVINRRAVAKDLGVSVAPVLEAFIYLEMEGYVETLPRKGTIVKPIRKADVYAQLIMREAIECQAARMYAGRPVREEFERLRALAMRVDESASDAVMHWRAEIEFHGALVSLSRCATLSNEFDRVIRLGTFYNMHRVAADIYAADAERENQSHLELLGKLVDDDAVEVENIIRDHLRSGKRKLFEEFAL